MIGQHTVWVYPDSTLTGGADLSCLIDTVTINHGRDDTGSQPEASSVSIDGTTDFDPLPGAVEIGAYVVVTTTTLTAHRRFLGRLTDIALGWEDMGEATPDSGVFKLTAVGTLADLGRKVVGDAPFPQELDGARVARVLALAGVVLNPATSDPGTVQILPRDIDSQPALDVAQGTAFSGGGVVWETAGGEVRYADSSHRKGVTSSLTLDACDLFVTPTWRRTLEGLVNEVSIGYGVAPEGGEQPRYTATNDASKGKFGRYGYTTTTELAAVADASALGQLLLVRNGSPVWVMAALPVDTKGLDDARMEALLSLDMHSLITLTGLPAIGAAPTTAVLWVEGWRETLEFGTHDLELIVSGYCRTVPAPRWDDVDPAWLWGGSTWTEQRRNLCGNPIGPTGTALTWWITTRTTAALNPTGDAYRLTITDATVASLAQRINGPFPSAGQGFATAVKVSPGKVYTLSADMRSNSAGGGGANMQWYDAAGTALGGTASTPVGYTLGSSAYTRVTLTGTAPAGAAYMYPGIGLWLGARNVGEWFDIRNVLIEEAPAARPWFDGFTPAIPGVVAYSWAGTPLGSESVATGATLSRSNAATNPSVQASPTVGWSSNDGARYPASDDATVSHSRGKSRMSQPVGTGLGVANGAIASLYDVGGTLVPVAPGQIWTASMWWRANVPANGDCRIYWLDAANTVLGGAMIGTPVAVPADGTWVRATITSPIAAPATATKMRVMGSCVRKGGAVTLDTDRAWADDCLITRTPANTHGDYFDGATPAAPNGLVYAWTGTPDASASAEATITPVAGGLPASLTWDDMTCLGPPADLGRWDDIAASQRWDQMPPATTWNNYGS